MLNVPYLLVVIVSVLAYYLGIAFLAGVGTILLLAVLQYFNLTAMSLAQRKLRAAQDGRLN